MATAEEKFEAEVKKMSREEKIDKMSDLDCWDIKAIMEYAECKLRESYEGMSDNDLNEEYMAMFDWDIDEFENDEDEDLKESFICNNDTCPATPFGINHAINCPEYK